MTAREISPARAAAFDVVRRVFEDEAYADRALRAAAAKLDERDRALARQLAYGTVQRGADARPRDRGGRPPPRARLDAPVRAALRLGAFQLAFLDGVPRYAAVNKSVELVRRARLERAVPFANAVLRRLADEGRAHVEALPDTTLAGGGAQALLSGLGRRDVVARLGPDGARALMQAQNEAPPLVVRLVRGEIEG